MLLAASYSSAEVAEILLKHRDLAGGGSNTETELFDADGRMKSLFGEIIDIQVHAGPTNGWVYAKN